WSPTTAGKPKANWRWPPPVAGPQSRIAGTPHFRPEDKTMARWLAALRNDEKKSEIATDAYPQNPQNSPGGFEGFEGRRPEPFSNFHCKGWAVWDEEDW